MRKLHRPRLLLAVPAACLSALASLGAPGAEAPGWPSWRGPAGDGISAETGFLKTWPEGGPKELWRIPLGSGFSSFAAVGDRLFTMTERQGVGGSSRQEAICLDAASGRGVWSRELEDGYKEGQGGNGPRSTPAVKDGIAYFLGAHGTLAALDAATGDPVWTLNILERFKAENITWGLSASPHIEGDLVIVPVGAPSSPVVALDRKTGEPVWRCGSDGQGDIAGYATPLAITHAGERQVIVVLGRSVISLDPDGGKILWKHYWRTDFDVNAASPVYADGKVFVSSGYDHGAVLLEIPKKRGRFPREVWKSKVLKNKFSSSVIHEGSLYGFDNTILKCVEFATGRERWRQRGFGYGSLLVADGHLILLGEGGGLALAKADPSAYIEVARKDGVLRGSVAWTVPVLHRGVLYLRNLVEAVALDLRP